MESLLIDIELKLFFLWDN